MDIRDWLWGSWTNSINGTTTTNVFNSTGGFDYQARLDMQTIDLPGDFLSQTLETIRVIDTGSNPFYQRILLNGVTVEVIPEPSTITLFGLGAIGLFGYGWRRRKR